VAEQSSTEKGPVEEVLTPESASPEVEIADWLAAMKPVEDAAVEETPVAEDAVEAEVPDWLAQMITPGESEAGLPPLVDAETEELLEEVAPTGEEPVILAPEQVKVPDWLLSAAPSESDKEAPLGEVALESEQPDLVQAEIPAWLQAMRPDVAPTPVSIEEEREVETDGLLAGIAGVVQAASVVTAVPSVTAKPEGIGAEATTARARLWQELIARSAQPSPRELPRSAEGKTRYQVERWVVYAIVFVAVVVPLVVDVDLTTVFDLDQPLTAEAGVAYDLVNDVVTQGAPVLLAFDYGPAYMGELDLQAASLLRHLSLRQARIIAMSLTPEGAGLAQRLIDDVLIKEGYQSGQDYVNLGYFPGDAAGIRALRFLPPHFQNQTFDGMELQDALVFDDGERFELGDMALIAVLTSDDDNLRWWVEQTTALEGELETELPLLAGVSAAIEALVRPYYDMELPQIDGLVIGLAGAADYERALGQMDGPAHTRLEAQLVGQGAVLALIVIAVLFYGLFRKGESDG
jgi:hypothetical protein